MDILGSSAARKDETVANRASDETAGRKTDSANDLSFHQNETDSVNSLLALQHSQLAHSLPFFFLPQFSIRKKCTAPFTFKANKALTMTINQQSVKRCYPRCIMGLPVAVDLSDNRPKQGRDEEEEGEGMATKNARLKYRQFEVIHWSGGNVSTLGKRGRALPTKETKETMQPTSASSSNALPPVYPH
jgi:hypothetical protein